MIERKQRCWLEKFVYTTR